MRYDSLEPTPELLRLAREHKSALQRLSLLIHTFEERARADEQEYVLRNSPQRWEKVRANSSRARCF
jgi:hypothetical protein